MLCNKTWASDISTQTCLNDQWNVSSQAKIVMMKCNPNPYVLCVNCWVLFDFRGKEFHEGPHNCNRTVDLMPFRSLVKILPRWKFVLPKHFFSFSIVTSSPPCFIYEPVLIHLRTISECNSIKATIRGKDFNKILLSPWPSPRRAFHQSDPGCYPRCYTSINQSIKSTFICKALESQPNMSQSALNNQRKTN